MRRPDGYKTRQRAVIEKMLSEQGGMHFTVDAVLDELHKKGETVGRTTVWRCLERLESEGKVRKYAQAGECACYQYIQPDSECSEHFHLKCERCGCLIHVQCDNLCRLGAHIEEEHGFRINPLKTVLYGVCEKCADQ